LRRVVDRTGRSRAFVNGTAATAQQLGEVGELLLDIHGQHAHQSLVRASAQRELLDSNAGLGALVREVGDAYREWQRLAKVRAEQETHTAARAAEREQLSWQVDELTTLAPRPGEWDEVQAEQNRLAHAASLIEGARAALDAISESDDAASAAVSAAVARLRALTGYDAALAEPVALLDGAVAQIEEAAHALRRYADRVELDPGRLTEVERRLEALHSAARKLRVGPELLPEVAERLAARLVQLEAASDIGALRAQEDAARQRYGAIAAKLSVERRQAAGKLARQVTAAMKELAMGGGRLEVALHALEAGSAQGNESVELLVSTNPGIEPRPLAKVASGGELSRISLAIQVITAKAGAVPTLVFDEVDAGIGGAVAEVVGRNLRVLGAERQVLCVTHLPQVAAQADHQWSVAKLTVNGATRTRVTLLDADERVEEVARMLGGMKITDASRSHAREMLRTAARKP
jgi:DNA repair protein RecN (Recombination protein N)